LNIHVFFSLADARQKLEGWRQDYNAQRPHSALGDRPPADFAQREKTNIEEELLKAGNSSPTWSSFWVRVNSQILIYQLDRFKGGRSQ